MKELCPGKMLCYQEFRPKSGLPAVESSTGVGTSGKPEETYSGVWDYPYIGSSGKFRKFRSKSGLLTDLAKKTFLDLAF
jgi:hypothetical protein